MAFQSDPYSVLLVSASEKLNTAVLPLLPGSDFWPVTAVGSLSRAKRLLLTHFNPKYDPDALLNEAREYFPAAERAEIGDIHYI